MSFARLVLHMTESNNYLCAKAGDVPEPTAQELKETDGKDKLVAALKASFEFCNTAMPKVTDAKLGDTIEVWGGRKAPRAFAFNREQVNNLAGRPPPGGTEKIACREKLNCLPRALARPSAAFSNSERTFCLTALISSPFGPCKVSVRDEWRLTPRIAQADVHMRAQIRQMM
jgi:hypothetical protein